MQATCKRESFYCFRFSICLEFLWSSRSNGKVNKQRFLARPKCDLREGGVTVGGLVDLNYETCVRDKLRGILNYEETIRLTCGLFHLNVRVIFKLLEFNLKRDDGKSITFLAILSKRVEKRRVEYRVAYW